MEVQKSSSQDEMTLKELILKVQEYSIECLRNWKVILLFVVRTHDFGIFWIYPKVTKGSIISIQTKPAKVKKEKPKGVHQKKNATGISLHASTLFRYSDNHHDFGIFCCSIVNKTWS
jgi:hypothetical protein